MGVGGKSCHGHFDRLPNTTVRALAASGMATPSASLDSFFSLYKSVPIKKNVSGVPLASDLQPIDGFSQTVRLISQLLCSA